MSITSRSTAHTPCGSVLPANAVRFSAIREQPEGPTPVWRGLKDLVFINLVNLVSDTTIRSTVPGNRDKDQMADLASQHGPHS